MHLSLAGATGVEYKEVAFDAAFALLPEPAAECTESTGNAQRLKLYSHS